MVISDTWVYSEKTAYKPLTSNPEQSGEGSLEIPPNNSNQSAKENNLETDAIAKFQQRQEKSQNYGKLDNCKVE